MAHPFAWIPQPYRWYVLAAFFIATAAFAWKLASQGRPLTTAAAPRGILSYEFAWSEFGSGNVLNSWKQLKEVARLQLKLDFAFLVVYPLLFSLACGMLSDSPRNGRAIVGTFLSWAVLLAGPLDATENFALLQMLNAGASEYMAKIAGWCAGLKFVLVYSALGYIVFEGIPVLVSKG